MRKVELLPTQDCEAGYGPANLAKFESTCKTFGGSYTKTKTPPTSGVKTGLERDRIRVAMMTWDWLLQGYECCF